MSKQLKMGALITFTLAILFYLFFQICKQNPALSQVNPFAEDPYDAVGSFSVQLALFTALLSLIRAFRPYQPGKASDSQELLLLRAAYISCLSIAVTLVADVVAMIRHLPLWTGEAAGRMLAILVGGMALLTVLVAWLLYRTMRRRPQPSAQHLWPRAIAISLMSILLLALYPESWRQSIPGALFTVFVGIAFLFLPVWAIGMALSPSPETFFEDFIDDLVSIYRWLKVHVGPFALFFSLFEKILNWSLVRLVLLWLNPRKHTWNLPLLVGIVMGTLLLLAEVFAQGGGSYQVGQLAKIAAIFLSIECAGVLLGYSLLAKPLGLFQQTSIFPTSYPIHSTTPTPAPHTTPGSAQIRSPMRPPQSADSSGPG
jgi:hypothetical protein